MSSSSSLLDEAQYRDKLAKLNTSAHSIEHTSTWCMFHRADARRVAEVWEEVFVGKAGAGAVGGGGGGDQSKRLAMVYLANDIIQNRWVGVGGGEPAGVPSPALLPPCLFASVLPLTLAAVPVAAAASNCTLNLCFDSAAAASAAPSSSRSFTGCCRGRCATCWPSPAAPPRRGRR